MTPGSCVFVLFLFLFFALSLHAPLWDHKTLDIAVQDLHPAVPCYISGQHSQLSLGQVQLKSKSCAFTNSQDESWQDPLVVTAEISGRSQFKFPVMFLMNLGKLKTEQSDLNVALVRL